MPHSFCIWLIIIMVVCEILKAWNIVPYNFLTDLSVVIFADRTCDPIN